MLTQARRLYTYRLCNANNLVHLIIIAMRVVLYECRLAIIIERCKKKSHTHTHTHIVNKLNRLYARILLCLPSLIERRILGSLKGYSNAKSNVLRLLPLACFVVP